MTRVAMPHHSADCAEPVAGGGRGVVINPATVPDRRLQALRRFALSITAFNIAGHTVLGFEQSPLTPLVCAVAAYVAELFLEWLDARGQGRPLRFDPVSPSSVVTFLLPAHISAMASAMLLFAGPVLWPYVAASVTAVCAKHLFKAPVDGKMRHFMNPSNFGIATVLLLAPSVGIAPPYQFTADLAQPFDWLIPLVIVMLGTMLNVGLTAKWPLILAWVAGFAVQGIVRGFVLGTGTLPALVPLTGTAFILFTNYMITDPGSTPVTIRGQVGFGLAVAVSYGVLVTLHVTYTLFFALVLICALRGVMLWATVWRERWATR